jgi:hypothetical protein
VRWLSACKVSIKQKSKSSAHSRGTQGSSISKADPIKTKLQRARARAAISNSATSSSSSSKRTKRKEKQKKAIVHRKKHRRDHARHCGSEGDTESDTDTDKDDELSLSRLNEKCLTPRRRAFVKAAKRMARARAALHNAFPNSFERHDFNMDTLEIVAELGDEFQEVLDYLLQDRQHLRDISNLVRAYLVCESVLTVILSHSMGDPSC